MSYKTKTGEKFTEETGEFLFYVSLIIAVVRTAAIKQNSSVSTVTSSPVFVFVLLISAPSLGVYYCQQLTLSVCLSRCLSVWHTPSNCFFFCFSMESSHFLAVISPCAPLQNFFFDFWFRLPNAQHLLPKICTKSPISRLVWQIDQRCLGLPGGFRRWLIQRNHAKCCGAEPCCHGNKIWARRGDPVAYRLVLVLSQLRRRLTESWLLTLKFCAVLTMMPMHTWRVYNQLLSTILVVKCCFCFLSGVFFTTNACFSYLQCYCY